MKSMPTGEGYNKQG